jgi:DNA-binding FadR family transcriptional regulator
LPLKAVEPRRLYRQIAEQLRELINNGEYPVGGRLPSARELADSLGVSRPSVAREIVEASVADEAARRATPRHLRDLDAILDRMERHGADSRWIELDREFHVAIAAIIENGVLARFVGQLFDQRINPYFAQLASYFENALTWRQALDEHRAIRDAIAAADPRAARVAMKRHLKLSAERFTRGFGEPIAAPSGTGPMPAERGPAIDPQLPPKTTRRKHR